MSFNIESEKTLIIIALLYLCACIACVVVIEKNKISDHQDEIDELSNQIDFWKHKACKHSNSPPEKCNE